jgi:hypothetical protein
MLCYNICNYLEPPSIIEYINSFTIRFQGSSNPVVKLRVIAIWAALVQNKRCKSGLNGILNKTCGFQIHENWRSWNNLTDRIWFFI